MVESFSHESRVLPDTAGRHRLLPIVCGNRPRATPLHRKVTVDEDSISLRRTVAALHNRSANMGHVIGATFYLFGFVLFLGLQSAPRTLGHSRNPLEMEVLPTFVVLFAFAANVLLVLLALHLLSWLVRNQLHSSWLHREPR